MPSLIYINSRLGVNMELKSYVALDIETTGLEDGSQVLQIAMIFDDWKKPVKELEARSFLVDNSDEIFNGKLEAFALAMNSWIFDAISDKKEKSNFIIHKTPAARAEFRKFLLECFDKLDGKSLTFAGKNIGEFDLKHLRINGFFEGFSNGIISHRNIDIGALYLPDFGYVPTQGEINKLTGRKAVSHDALDDATDVVCAIRHKLKRGI